MAATLTVDLDNIATIFQSLDNAGDDVTLKFAGELAKIKIDVSGKNYHGSVPGELARGLWEFQEEIYRAATFALYGVEDIRKLRPDERLNFELVFDVSEGSSILEAALEKILDALADGIKTMDSKDKMRTLIVIAAILAGGWVITSAIEGATTVAEAKEKKEVSLDQEKTKRDQFNAMANITSNAVVGRFAQASEVGAKAIIKGASDADSISIGNAYLDRTAIIETNQRAGKEKATPLMLLDEFTIISAEKRGTDFTKFVLASAKYPEFRILIADEEFEQDAKDKLWAAFREYKPVRLEVNATYIRDQIKTANLVRVH